MLKKIKKFFPSKDEFLLIEKSLSKREWAFVMVATLILVFSFLGVFENLNKQFSKEIPAYGGEHILGIMGTPRFVNPVLAITDADEDLVMLTYSGLLRRDENGNLVSDLASSYELSEDRKEYYVEMKPGNKFHDGTEITATDVAFTVEAIQNPDIKSPLRIKWQGVAVEVTGEYSLTFRLKEPFSGFPNMLTLGILPSHLWQDLSPTEFAISTYNSSPVGSGPYMIKDIEMKSSGVPVAYTLGSYNDFALGKPYIDTIKVKFYPNEEKLVEAYKGGLVDEISGVSPRNIVSVDPEGTHVRSTALPRVFGLFFNKNENPVYANKYILDAIELSIDKNRIISDIFYGYATPIDSPLPPSLYNGQAKEVSFDQTKALNSLTAKGWKQDDSGFLYKEDGGKSTYLALKVATSDTEELISVAEHIKEDLSKIGVAVEIQIFDVGTLNQDVIRTREFDVLLFGEIIEHESDLFAFWHSSQRNDPGLNVTSFLSPDADNALTALRSGSTDDVPAKISSLVGILSKEPTAVFLYSPHLIMANKGNIKNNLVENIIEPKDRLSSIYKSNIYSEYVYSLKK